MSNEPATIVLTGCKDWSLNKDSSSDKYFWWNDTFSVSMWEDVLRLQQCYEDIHDDDVWRAFLNYQVSYAFKMCSICHVPEANDDMKICCYCGSTIHVECSNSASDDQIAWKPSNAGYEKHLRVCFSCDGVEYAAKDVPKKKSERDSVLRVAQRILSMRSELPEDMIQDVKRIRALARNGQNDESALQQLKQHMTTLFQSKESLNFLAKKKMLTKGGGTGVVAVCDIPAFSIIGVYPGYNDELSGEQAKIGRPTPIYALMDLNCADYYNEVFVELASTFTPFINEPTENEKSNCAWIQESYRHESRFSVISVREIKRGEELLIGYGPAYTRSYSYSYDAYAFHAVEGYKDPPCYALWHWPTPEEKDASFVCYIGYIADKDKYAYWESTEEQETSKGIRTK